MPTKSSALEKARAAIEEQIATLDEERASLERALSELSGTASRRGRRGRPRGATAKPRSGARRSGTSRSGGRKGSAPRRDQALRLIRANPGIRPSELARKMGVAAPYVYRVVPPLIDAGKIAKEGKGFVAT